MKANFVPGGVWASFPVLLTSMFLALTSVPPANADGFHVNIPLPEGPGINTQPTNQTVAAEDTATFSVGAYGYGPFSFQWYFDNAAITGATNPILTLNNAQPGEAGAYYAAVANPYGSATSAMVTLTVDAAFPPEAPYIITEPANQMVTAGDTAAFSVNAVGGSPLSYQWYFNGTNLWDATNATLTLDDASAAYAGAFYVTIADAFGSATSTVATLTITSNLSPTNKPPGIVTQPGDQTVAAGGTATFTVIAGGTPPLSYQWYFKGTNLWYATNTTLILNDVTPAQAGPYYVTIANAYGSTNSATATLTVNSASPPEAPYIVTQPRNEIVTAGSTVGFNVGAGGAAPLSYQWYFDGTNLVGTNVSLILDDVSPADAGIYQVFISNAYGSTSSVPATLIVNSSPSCDPVPSGIISWWPGEGNANDIIGNNNGIASTGLGYTNGEVGQAFSMNATNANFYAPASASLDAGAHGTGLTIEAWIDPSNVNGLQPISEWNNSPEYPPHAGNIGVQLWIGQNPGSEGVLCATFLESTNQAHYLQVSSPSGALVPNVWQHVAVTYDPTNGNITLYINGVTVASQFWGYYVPETRYNFWVDHRPGDEPGDWTYGTYLSGPLDELSLYDHALSSNEIAAIYLAGSAGKCPPISSAMAPYIIAQPTNQTVMAGGTATFRVDAGGAVPLSYQWFFDGTNLVGTNATLTLNDVTAADAGAYRVFISNAYGSTNSKLATLTVSSSSSCDPVPSGIISWWPGEGNANDIIGNNNGVLENDVAFTQGVVGQAFHFNGSNQDVQIPYSTSLEPTNVTVECWVKLDALASPVAAYPGLQYIIFKQNSRGGNFEGYDLEKNRINGQDVFRFQVTSVDGEQVPAASKTIPQPGVWYHLAGTYDSTTVKIYVNGVLEGSAVAGFPMDYGIEPVYFGTTGQGFDGRLDGALDEVSIYNKALSSNEIAAIYLAGSAGKCPPISSAMAPYIIAQPTNQTVMAGGTATFRVDAGGAAPLSYQWFFDGTNLVGTNATLTLNDVTAADAGTYRLFISNAYGSTNSKPATLTVNSSGVDHFTWIPILSPRFPGMPFLVTITARDSASGAVSNFTGSVQITSTNGILVFPPVSGDFVQGMWMGDVTVPLPATNLVLKAAGASGHNGFSNPFNVVNRPVLVPAPFGNGQQIAWPASAPGFVLEMTTNLGLGNWLAVPGQPLQLSNLCLQPIVPPGANSQIFYRLRFTGQ
jgi:hypothetical protein